MATMRIPAFKMFELQDSTHVQRKTVDGHKLEHGNSIFDEEAPHYSEHVTRRTALMAPMSQVHRKQWMVDHQL
jgi:hypothetical protein